MSAARPTGQASPVPADAAANEEPAATRVLGDAAVRRRRDRPNTRDRIRPLVTPSDRAGEVLGGTWKVERLVARGGMGAVWAVAHARLERHFAVKFLDPRYARDHDAYARFRQEAEIAASLHHESIVEVFDFNTDPYGNPYIVMEFVEGETLEECIRKRRLSRREVLAVCEPLCHALDVAHRAGIVHRDLKPSNVMVKRLEGGGWRVKLLDFGISKIKQDTASGMTADNVVMGTPNYMSPEQASGNARDVDARTDVFAMGTMLYELLTGRRAFDQEALPRILHAIVYEEPPRLTEVVPDLPEAVARVVERSMAKKPDDRFASTRVLLQALKAAFRMEGEAERVRILQRASKAGGVGRWIAAGAAALVAGLGGVWLGSQVPRPAGGAIVEPEPPGRASAPVAVAAAPAWPAELATPGAQLLPLDDGFLRADAHGIARLVDPDGKPVQRPLPGSAAVRSVALTAEGTGVVVTQSDGTVSLWDRALEADPVVLRAHREPLLAAAAGAGYVVALADRELRLVAADSGRLLKKLPLASAGQAVALSRGEHPLVFCAREGSLDVVDADAREVLATFPLPDAVQELTVEPAGADGEVRVEMLHRFGVLWLRRTHRFRRAVAGQDARLELVGQRAVASP
jgi:tRNA A-37 threonylcarbamoyl transferase component Bud32